VEYLHGEDSRRRTWWVVSLDEEQMEALASYGVGNAQAEYFVFLADQLEQNGGPVRTGYWRTLRPGPIGTTESLRDEMLLFGMQDLGVVQGLLHEKPVHSYANQFAGAFGYVGRSMLQSLQSVDQLATTNCYIDGLSICRTLVSRTNLLTLFALNPWLFDEWLLRPSDQKFLDGRIRDALATHGIEWFGRLYDELSEAIHLQDTILRESGYLSPGLFPTLDPMRARLFVIAKILIGTNVGLGLLLARQDHEGHQLRGTLALSEEGFAQTRELLASNRFEHIGVTIAPDRHWTPTGKNKYAIMTHVDFEQLSDQLAKFHRDAGQRKQLKSPYDFDEAAAVRQRESLQMDPSTEDGGPS
jgi:hypothetical protein